MCVCACVMKQEPFSVSTGGDEVEASEWGSASLSNVCGTTRRKAEDLSLYKFPVQAAFI